MSLNRKKINLNTFNKILDIFKDRIDIVDDLGPYFYGYRDKKRIKYNPKTNNMICQAKYINYVSGLNLLQPDWKQYVLIRGTEVQENEAEDVMYANKANKIINNILLKYYNESEIEELLNSHIHTKDSAVQRRLPSIYEKNIIHHFHNCVYYDINGAHRDALCEIFPLAKKDFLKVNKQAANIYVGDLCNHNHRDTYYWIVNRTANILMQNISHIGGLILYANTDGVIAYHPQNTLNTSDKLGEFKSVIIDDEIYYYIDSDPNYTGYHCIQYATKTNPKEKKGTCPLEFRNEMDLSKGIVIRYKKYREENIEKYEDVSLITKEIREYD